MTHILLLKLALAALVACGGLLIAHHLHGRRGLCVAGIAAVLAFGAMHAVSGRAQASAPRASR